MNVSDSGRPCMKWSESGTQFVREDGNYCRNPDADNNGIWCFVETNDLNNRISPEYCPAEVCEKVVEFIEKNYKPLI